jgi:hypothetical protein
MKIKSVNNITAATTTTNNNNNKDSLKRNE